MGSRTNYSRNIGYAFSNPPAHDVLELLSVAGVIAHTSIVVTVAGLQFRIEPPQRSALEALCLALDLARVSWSDNAMRTIFINTAK